jgi:hypothetical protein
VELQEIDIILRQEDMYGPEEKHHIVFRSHGGIDSDLNLIRLPMAFHKGPNGPHQNKAADLILKLSLQDRYFELFSRKYYSLEEIVRMINPHNKKSRLAIEKQVKKQNVCTSKGYRREDIVRTLMGGKIYG